MKTLKILGIFLQLKWQETFGAIDWVNVCRKCLKVVLFLLAAHLAIAILTIVIFTVGYLLGQATLFFQIWYPNQTPTFQQIVSVGLLVFTIFVILWVIYETTLKKYYQRRHEFWPWICMNWKKATGIVEASEKKP